MERPEGSYEFEYDDLQSALPHAGCAHDHDVQFYDQEHFFSETVSAYLVDALRLDEPAVVVVTDEHRDAVRGRLLSHSIDVDGACNNRQITFQHLPETLASFMDGALPNEQRLKSNIASLLEQNLAGRERARLRVCGEMSDVVWRTGNAAGAIRIEELWNQHTRPTSIATQCLFALRGFAREVDARLFREICRQHVRVRPAEFHFTGDAVARGISLLQQRSCALATEIEHRRTLEQALRDAQARCTHAEEAANTVRSEFLTAMSHELLTPLNGIIGYQDLLCREVGGPITPRQRQYLEQINASALQLFGRLDQILTQSQSGADVAVEKHLRPPEPGSADA
ncbi:MAG: MEDS domain-containing protein [Longimicrobiales bacterium]